jgi:hypothetical protein
MLSVCLACPCSEQPILLTSTRILICLQLEILGCGSAQSTGLTAPSRKVRSQCLRSPAVLTKLQRRLVTGII